MSKCSQQEIIKRLEECNSSLERIAFLTGGKKLKDVSKRLIESTDDSTQCLIEVHRNNEVIARIKKDIEIERLLESRKFCGAL